MRHIGEIEPKVWAKCKEIALKLNYPEEQDDPSHIILKTISTTQVIAMTGVPKAGQVQLWLQERVKYGKQDRRDALLEADYNEAEKRALDLISVARSQLSV